MQKSAFFMKIWWLGRKIYLWYLKRLCSNVSHMIPGPHFKNNWRNPCTSCWLLQLCNRWCHSWLWNLHVSADITNKPLLYFSAIQIDKTLSVEAQMGLIWCSFCSSSNGCGIIAKDPSGWIQIGATSHLDSLIWIHPSGSFTIWPQGTYSNEI